MSARWIEPVVFAVLLATVGLRPLISESFHTSGVGLGAADLLTADPWAATTLLFDAVILLSAGAVAVARLTGRGSAVPRYRPTGLESGVVILVLAAVVSCLVAADKRPAVNATADLLAGVLLAMLLVQLLDRPQRVSVLLRVVVASAAVNAAECAHQRWVSFPETEVEYRAHREEFWARQGVPLDSEQVALFERRLLAREASGFMAHSNVAAGYLVLAGLAALGLGARGTSAGGASARWTARVCAGLLAAGLLLAVLLTGGTGAMLSAAVGLALCGGAVRWRSRLVGRGRQLLMAGGAAVLLAIGGVVALGIVRGGLPGASLDFRWQYWTASAAMIRDHGLAGVGAENFGDHYLRYKTIQSPEEVQNPHNFVVQMACEYGVPGLLALVLLLIGGARILVRPLRSFSGGGLSAPGQSDAGDGAGQWVWPILLAGLIFLPRIAMLPSRDPYFVLWTTLFGVLVWLPAYVLAGAASTAAGGDRACSAGLGTALNCALLAFLLQDTINFALFVPGPRITFFAILGAALAGRATSVDRATQRDVGQAAPRRWAPIAYAGFAVCVAWSLMAPLRAEHNLRQARHLAATVSPVTLSSLAEHPAAARFAAASRLDPLDATALVEWARWLEASAPVTGDPLGSWAAALRHTTQALERAPRHSSLWRQAARLHMLCGQGGGGAEHFPAAVQAMRRALDLYPARPQSYSELGDCLAAVGTVASLEEALAGYCRALELDAARPAWEQLRRLSPRIKAEIQDKITQTEARLAAGIRDSSP